MDLITYQVFDDLYVGPPGWGPEFFHLSYDPVDKTSPLSVFSEGFSNDVCFDSSNTSVSTSESPCFTDSVDVPDEVVDLFVDYANSPINSSSPSKSESPISFDNAPPGAVESFKLSQFTCNSITHPLSSKNDPCLSRKVASREASFRYRQKLKARSAELNRQLDDALTAYRRARLAYEKTEQTFEVMQDLLLRLLASKG